jgi:type I restriction enzyme S subunit
LRPEVVLDLNYLNYQLFYYPFTALHRNTGRKKLTQDALINAPIKFCSIEEQEQIVEEIESRLSICDQLETTIIENLQKAEALRQSILKQAFEGKLVPQDPTDEPAEKLLERIQAERIVNGNTVKKSKNLSPATYSREL